jgi:class 3 adenylate cyclase
VRELPSGTVTFLFSDIEGSTRLLKELGDGWGDVIGEHNRLLREAFSAAGGGEVDRQGDAFFAVFPRATGALAAAAQAQRALAAHEWPGGASLRVRMGVHTGEPHVGEEGYLGLDVVRAARICAAANGGQVLVSETTAALGRGDEFELADLGEHRLKDFDEPQRLWELLVPGVDRTATTPRTAVEAVGAPAPIATLSANPAALVKQALETVRSLDLSAIEELGPRIERQVADALARRSVPRAPGSLPRAPASPSLPARPRWPLVLGALAILLALVIVFVLVKAL